MFEGKVSGEHASQKGKGNRNREKRRGTSNTGFRALFIPRLQQRDLQVLDLRSNLRPRTPTGAHSEPTNRMGIGRGAWASEQPTRGVARPVKEIRIGKLPLWVRKRDGHGKDSSTSLIISN